MGIAKTLHPSYSEYSRGTPTVGWVEQRDTHQKASSRKRVGRAQQVYLPIETA
jgi:hypothetical protein